MTEKKVKFKPLSPVFIDPETTEQKMEQLYAELKAAPMPPAMEYIEEGNDPFIYLLTITVLYEGKDWTIYHTHHTTKVDYLAERVALSKAHFNECIKRPDVQKVTMQVHQVYPMSGETYLKAQYGQVWERPVNKTYLNGPKKDLSFLQKKGKHYA